MIVSSAWEGRRYAVLGLARSGIATVEALLAAGARVTAWDADEAARSMCSGEGRSGDQGSGLRRSTAELADPLTLDLTGFEAVIVSPGVPLNRHPIAAHAAAAGVPVIGDIELFAQARAELPPHKVVGITGTNGKSTTTALVHHILQTAGVPSAMGGNIGLPILAQEPLPAEGVYVLELSSYQIDLTRTLDCDVAVLLNITPDHLDRYDGFDAYAASKARLFYELQTARHLSVLVADDGIVSTIAAEIEPFREWSMLAGDPVNALLNDGKIGSQNEWPALGGPHNLANVAAAVEACRNLGVHVRRIGEALRSFPGLPHRMERVLERKGVEYVNDSKATNAEAASPALASFSAIRWILGGRAKEGELDACLPHFDHIRSAYTIGEAGPLFADLLRPHMTVRECERLDRAVAAAAADAEPGDTVLLSPAAASFDQFADFEERGRAFVALVEALR